MQESAAKPTRKPAKGPASSSKADLTTLSSAPPAETPRTLEKALGLQVRMLRRERELSVVDLASAAKISTGMMSKIENGQISPSLSTIQALATALNTPFTSLFTAFEEKRDCSHVQKGKGVIIERRGSKAGHVYELLGAAIGGQVAVEPYLITLKNDAEAYTGFHHAGVEFIYMLTGEVVYRHGDEQYRLKPGDSLLFDSSALHGPDVLIKTPMTFLSVIIYPKPTGD